MLRSQKTATLEDGSSNLFGTWSVWFLRHQWAKNKPPCGGSFSLGALRLIGVTNQFSGVMFRQFISSA